MLKQFTGLLRRGAAGEASWGVADQAISSLTNFLVLFLAARQTNLERFGQFSVAFTVYILVLWVARSLVGEPLVIRFTTADGELRKSAGGSAAGAALLIGSLAGLVVALPAVAGVGWIPALVAMGVCLPALLAQDTYRYLLLAAGRARSAAINDCLWLAVQSAAVLIVIQQQASVEWLIGAFGAGAACAAALGSKQTGAAPRPGAGVGWLRNTADLGMPFLVELVGIHGVAQLSLLAVAAAGQVRAVGQVRAALLLLSPVTVVCSGLLLVGSAEAVRIRDRSRQSLRRFTALLGSTALLVVIWAAVILAIPNRAGVALLGDNWARGSEVLVPLAVMSAATLYMLAGMAGLRALGAARRSLGLRLWAAPVFILSTLAGAAAAGGRGVAGGLALSSALSAALTWTAFLRELTREDSGHEISTSPLVMGG